MTKWLVYVWDWERLLKSSPKVIPNNLNIQRDSHLLRFHGR